MLRREIGFALVGALLLNALPARAAESSPENWTNYLVVTYESSARGSLPLGVQAVRREDERVIVDLGRKALPSDLRRFTDDRVARVEPVIKMRAALEPSDPRYGEQWGTEDTRSADYSVHAETAWDLTTGSADIVVAVLDTGITVHTEFVGRLVDGYDFIDDVATANDGDGRDADPSDPGDWDAWDDSSWHGTHVAGIIGATGNNGAGIAGLNWVSKILPVRVLGTGGGYDTDIADAIRWAAGLEVEGAPVNENPANVINLSLGGFGDCGSYVQEAIDDAREAGSIVVVAAGNNAADASLFSPANCNGVITVAATAQNGRRAYYSNYGESVEIAAPGGDYHVDNEILSTINLGTTTPGAQGYTWYQGTSMAAPYVSGVISLLLSLDPTLTESEVLDLIAETATPFPSHSASHSCSTANMCGAGIINAADLLSAVNPAGAAQTIDFPEVADQYLGIGTFDPGATSDQGLTISYTATPAGVCTISGDKVRVLAVGTCTVTARQRGTMAVRRADPVSRDVTILPAVAPSLLTDFAFDAVPFVGTPVDSTQETWSGGPTPSVGYLWYRCSRTGEATTSSRTPSGCTRINGATAASYTPVAADLGRYLRVAATASNVANRRGVTRVSVTSAVVVGAPIFDRGPSASSSPRVGRSVSAGLGRVQGTAPIVTELQWYRCTGRVSSSSSELDGRCSAIDGETGGSYLPVVGDIGFYLMIRVTATNAHGSASTYSASSRNAVR